MRCRWEREKCKRTEFAKERGRETVAGAGVAVAVAAAVPELELILTTWRVGERESGAAHERDLETKEEVKGQRPPSRSCY